MFLCGFTVCFRLERAAFVRQGAKRHDSCLKVLLGLNPFLIKRLISRNFQKFTEHAGFKQVAAAAEFYSASVCCTQKQW